MTTAADLIATLEAATPHNAAKQCHTARRMLVRILHANDDKNAVSAAYDMVFEAIKAYEAALLGGDQMRADGLLGEIQAKLEMAVDIQNSIAN